MDSVEKSESSKRKLIEFSESLFPILRERATDCEENREIPERTIEDLMNGGIIRSTVQNRLGG